jgi:hypothetical protein
VTINKGGRAGKAKGRRGLILNKSLVSFQNIGRRKLLKEKQDDTQLSYETANGEQSSLVGSPICSTSNRLNKIVG